MSVDANDRAAFYHGRNSHFTQGLKLQHRNSASYVFGQQGNNNTFNNIQNYEVGMPSSPFISQMKQKYNDQVRLSGDVGPQYSQFAGSINVLEPMKQPLPEPVARQSNQGLASNYHQPASYQMHQVFGTQQTLNQPGRSSFDNGLLHSHSMPQLGQLAQSVKQSQFNNEVVNHPSPLEIQQKNFHYRQRQEQPPVEVKNVIRLPNEVDELDYQKQIMMDKIKEIDRAIMLKEHNLNRHIEHMDLQDYNKSLYGQAPTHKQLIMEQFDPQSYPTQTPMGEYFNQSPPPNRSTPQKCFNSGHKNCSPKADDDFQKYLIRKGGDINIYDQMKQMDQEFRSRTYKNNDHFHLVHANQVYDYLKDKGPDYTAQALTKTIYSDEEEKMNEQKLKQMQYAQILIDQMMLKKEKVMREKLIRQNLQADLDMRPKLNKLKVPEIPRLPFYKSHSAEDLASRIEKDQTTQLLLEAQHQNNFGFFDKFYGPEKQIEEKYKKKKALELKEQLQDQIHKKQALEAQLKKIEVLREQQSRSLLQQQPRVQNTDQAREQDQQLEQYPSNTQQDQMRNTFGRFENLPEQTQSHGAFDQFKTNPSQTAGPPSGAVTGQIDGRPQTPIEGGFNVVPPVPIRSRRGRSPDSPFSHSEKRHLTPEHIKMQTLDKERYKFELMQQVKEKKERQEEAKRKKIEEDIAEENRVKRQREELQSFYQRYGSQRDHPQEENPQVEKKNTEEQKISGVPIKNTNEEHFMPDDPKFVQKPKVKRSPMPYLKKSPVTRTYAKSPPKPRIKVERGLPPMNEDLNAMRRSNSSQDLQKNKLPKSIPRQAGTSPPVMNQYQQKQMAENMKLFTESIAQMKHNQKMLIEQYNQELQRLRLQKHEISSQTARKDNELKEQLNKLTQEMNLIVRIIQQSGGVIMRDNIQQQSQPQPGPEQELQSQSQLKQNSSIHDKQDIIVNFNQQPTLSRQQSAEAVPQRSAAAVNSRRISVHKKLPPIDQSRRQSAKTSPLRQLSLPKLPHEVHVEPRKRDTNNVPGTTRSNKAKLPPLPQQPSSAKESIIVELKPVQLPSSNEINLEEIKQLQSDIQQAADEVNRLESKRLQMNKEEQPKEQSPLSPDRFNEFKLITQNQTQLEQSLPHVDLPLISNQLREAELPVVEEVKQAAQPAQVKDQSLTFGQEQIEFQKQNRLNETIQNTISQKSDQEQFIAQQIQPVAVVEIIEQQRNEIQAEPVPKVEPTLQMQQIVQEQPTLIQEAPPQDVPLQMQQQDQPMASLPAQLEAWQPVQPTLIEDQAAIDIPIQNEGGAEIPTPVQPTNQPIIQPTIQPTMQPTNQPTIQLTIQPTIQPTNQPIIQPTIQPTMQPTNQPTIQLTIQPTISAQNRKEKMDSIVSSFIEQKKINNEPVIIRKVSNKSRKQKEIQDALPKEIAVEQIDQLMFKNKSDLRTAIKETDIRDVLAMDKASFLDGKKKKLYNSNTGLENINLKQSFGGEMASSTNTITLHKPEHFENRWSLSAFNDELYKSQGTNMLVPDQVEEQNLSDVSGVFTMDSRINEYKKISSFFDKQQQFQELVYKQSNQKDVEPNIRYNKNDPFGLNMRLRQSLSNTNKILYNYNDHRFNLNIKNDLNLPHQSSGIDMRLEESDQDTGTASQVYNQKAVSFMHTINEEQSEQNLINTDDQIEKQMPGPNFNFNDASVILDGESLNKKLQVLTSAHYKNQDDVGHSIGAHTSPVIKTQEEKSFIL